MHITCVIATLAGGGAERVMTYLCEGLSARGHQITLLTLDRSVPDFYTLSTQVARKRIHLPPFKTVGFLGGFLRLWKMTRALQQTKPDVVISFMSINVLASCFLLRKPYIFADHLDIRQTPFSYKWKLLRNFLFRHAQAVTVLSERDRKFVARYHPKWNPVVVYNPALPITWENLPRPYFMQLDKQYVIAVGRLVKQKGFDLLLKSWQKVEKNFPQWRLAIIGAGNKENSLKNLAESLALRGVDFVSPIQGLQAVYQHAHLFVMSSRAEGFPMVLLEAMGAGLPVVSFQCTGPDVIVRNGVDGFLVKRGDIKQLSEKMAELMSNEVLRRSFGTRAQEVVNRFSFKQYIDAYERLCYQAMPNKLLH